MRVLKSVVKYLRFYGGPYQCNICGRHVRRFFPFSESLQSLAKKAGFPYNFQRMETLNYNNCNCPFCLSSDRERLYLLFIEKYVDLSKQINVLDFAPNASFSWALKERKNIKYTSADLFRIDFDLQLDICNMNSISEGEFDVLICSHILEHVPNPVKALSEIYRVLKPGALAIIMVPLFFDVDQTEENPDYNTSLLRQKYYGQDDHVRLFSRADFLDRINKAGFSIAQIGFDSFPLEEVKRYAIADNSVLYVCCKS